ncbi:MAG TPA: HNH endonuclease [Pyrinomonadaceae bacterium]|nr:HNH endonuclease [Pyrinomonadaceae bacterium]
MKFKYPEYEQYFHDLLCAEGEELSKYDSLFDLREPASVKRGELTGQKYKQAWEELEKNFGRRCQLQYVEDCEVDNPVVIDHVIPISSNILNKHLRKSKPLVAGKKVPTESFGSNDISNLVLACANCNSNKKHRFLNRERMRRILKAKGF